MTSKLAGKAVHLVSKSTGAEEDSSDSGSEVGSSKYILRVTAGPGYDTSEHTPVVVNGEQATPFQNEYMRGSIKVRIRGYQGLPRNSPAHTPYFDHPMHNKDQYSVGFSFVPKVDLKGDELWWGNDFDHPVKDRLPPGFNYAFNIVKKFIDPGIEADAYSDEPWLFAPALDCWFTFRIGDKIPASEHVIPHVSEEAPLEEGADGTGLEVRERLQIPSDSKRRKYYLSPERRKEFTFEKDRLYQGDFFNPYLDFNKLALRLPGFSVKVIKYINDKTHNLRYVFKNRVTGDVYFVVNITLLFGEDMQQALSEEEERSRVSSGQASEAISRDARRDPRTAPNPQVKGTPPQVGTIRDENIWAPEESESPAQEFHDAKAF